MYSFKNKIVLITGGTRGIGKALVFAFAKSKAGIVFTYAKSAGEAAKIKKEIKDGKGKCLAVQADAKDYGQCRAVIEKILKEFGRLDILVNNAGITRDKALVMMTPEEWHEVIDTNLNGTFNMTRAAITTFLKQKNGCIINMSSVTGLMGMPRQTNYSAAKAGIIGFTRSLAKEVAGYNIRVNAVCPGWTDTDMVSGLSDKIKEEILRNIPQKRMAQPREIARLCLFLASEDSSYMTGNIIKIDGGLTA